MERIIVSFTSYPKRIGTIDKVLDSLITQTVLPDKIVLYLARDEFKNENALPNFLKYEKFGFEIHWCDENLKSHKKWYYAFREYPDDIIITVDDDILYCNTAIERLLKMHRKYPHAVIARRTHLITCDSLGEIAPYKDWYMECDAYVGVPRMDLFATTGAGTLYPPKCFDEEVFHKSMFMEKCQYADDVWMKIMEVYNDVPVVLAEEQWEDIFLEEYNQEGLYVDYNDNGGNDRQLNAILMMYPYNKIGMKRIQNCIFAADRVNTFESQILEKKRTERIAEDICSKLSLYEPFYIYGAGKVGKGISKLWGRESKDYIKAFLVADVSRNVEEIDGISVVSYKECVGTSDKIVIALFNVNETEKVKKELLRCGIDETQIVQLSKKEKVALIKYSESII